MSIREFWENCRQENGGLLPSTPPPAWHFCDNQADADELAKLVIAGIKRGTTSLKDSYIREGEAIPKPKDLSIILDWSGHPQCVIETTAVHCWRFREAPAEFAAVEGEGDGSLEYWRRVHREAFGRECAAIGAEFHEDMLVICEEFRVIHPR